MAKTLDKKPELKIELDLPRRGTLKLTVQDYLKDFSWDQGKF